MEVEFKFERETKNTVRFVEVTEADTEPKLGIIYIPKNTLKELNWADGKNICVSVKAK